MENWKEFFMDNWKGILYRKLELNSVWKIGNNLIKKMGNKFHVEIWRRIMYAKFESNSVSKIEKEFCVENLKIILC